MGDFKCNSGISSDNKDFENTDKNNWNEDKTNKITDTYNPVNDNNYDPTNRVTESYDPESRKDYSTGNISDNDYKNASDCGCGDNLDNIVLPDDVDTVIYSETVYFNEPPYDYDKSDSDMRTSDLIEDEQEGSEFISNDSTRPQC